MHLLHTDIWHPNILYNAYLYQNHPMSPELMFTCYLCIQADMAHIYVHIHIHVHIYVCDIDKHMEISILSMGVCILHMSIYICHIRICICHMNIHTYKYICHLHTLIYVTYGSIWHMYLYTSTYVTCIYTNLHKRASLPPEAGVVNLDYGDCIHTCAAYIHITYVSYIHIHVWATHPCVGPMHISMRNIDM